jgi:hypothetical protein
MTTEQRQALVEFKAAVKGIEAGTDITGAQFICIDGYTNQYGEVSRQVINGGIPREPVLKKNLAKYLKLQKNAGMFAYYVEKYGNSTAILALNDLIKGATTCISGTNVRSQAQKDAYLPITNGMKWCIATKNLMIHGYMVSKVVLSPGEYPVVKHQAKTLCKNEMKKNLHIMDPKTFIIAMDKMGTVKMAGKTFTIPMLPVEA